MIKLRLMRTGKTNQPYFRIVACERRSAPKSAFKDILGSFDPVKQEFIIDKEKLEQWIKNGAKVSTTLNNLLIKEGIWAKSKLIKKSVKPKKKTEKEDKPPKPENIESPSKPEEKAEEKADSEPAKEETEKAEPQEEKQSPAEPDPATREKTEPEPAKDEQKPKETKSEK